MPTPTSSPPIRVAGVELGGTKCICTLATEQGDILDQRTLPTKGPEHTLPAISAHLCAWHADDPIAAIGIGSFGPVDLAPSSPGFGRIGRTPKPGWNDIDILTAIAGPFALPIWLDTDVNAAALAEHLWGAGRDVDRLAYVTVGTGVGVGFAGALVANAELGHVRIVKAAQDRRESTCPFHIDCVEGLCAGPAIGRLMQGEAPGDVPLDDPRWHNTATYLGQLCHTILSMGAADRILFGGGVINGNPGLIARIEAEMRRSLNGYLTLPDTVCAHAGLASLAGPLGTIALALKALSQSIDRGYT